MPGVDLNFLMRQAKEITSKVEKRKTELANETVEGKAGDGLVVATANGVQELKGLKIDKKAVDPNDTAMLEDLVIAAVNQALTNSREHMQKELGKISGGIKLPGLM